MYDYRSATMIFDGKPRDCLDQDGSSIGSFALCPPTVRLPKTKTAKAGLALFELFESIASSVT
jgi:hypothetical protein